MTLSDQDVVDLESWLKEGHCPNTHVVTRVRDRAQHIRDARVTLDAFQMHVLRVLRTLSLADAPMACPLPKNSSIIDLRTWGWIREAFDGFYLTDRGQARLDLAESSICAK